MADIQEIPLEPEGAVEKEEQYNEENETGNGNIPENIQPGANIEPEIPKRGRGRPKGSLNKSKAPPPPPPPKAKPAPKPRAKRKPPPEPQYESESSADDYQAAPQYDSRQIAAEVLGLLQHQKRQTNMARRNHYQSWFQNM